MKTQKNVLALVLILSYALFFTSCSKDDTTAPIILLNGGDVTIELQSLYTELGAVAEDDEDGEVEVEISGSVNTNLVGVYIITYTAIDAAGNIATEERIVEVINGASTQPNSNAFTTQGSYSCTITGNGQAPYTYNETLSLSTTLNNGSEWSKFGDYGNANAKLNILFGSNNQVTIPTTTIVCGSPAVARTFSGNGTLSGSTIILNVTEEVNGQSGSFVYTYIKN
jgi:hypothetical protein